ncbi:MAG: type III pantothenate kinase [Firmicutes bacterium]|nr:type III pantothenate kinase [Bacillota bacterium]
MPRLLAIDIGNTHIKIGLYSQGRWIEEWRLATDMRRTPDEYRLFVRGLLNESHIEVVDRAIVASVVPLLTPFFLRVVQSVSLAQPEEVVPPGYGLGVDYPAQNLGPDRFVNALAAWEITHRSVVVVDVGTTATVDAVVDGVFIGGAIAPGPHFLAQALAEGTARLPQVMPVIQPWSIGKNTEEAIHAGVGQGFVGMVKGLIENTRGTIGKDAPVILTGGWSQRLQPYLGFPVQWEPRLTLEGLRYADQWLHAHEMQGQ